MENKGTQGIEQALLTLNETWKSIANASTKVLDLTNQFVVQGAAFTSTSLTYVDVPGCTYTYVTGASPERFAITMQTLVKISTATTGVRIAISINGVDHPTGEGFSANIDFTSLQALAVFDASPNTTYTIKLRAKVHAASTLTIANDGLAWQKTKLISQPISLIGLATTPQNAINPYKFSAYHNTTQSLATLAYLSFNTKEFDTSNNYDGVNKFTAPVSGYYQFNTTMYVQGTGGAFTFLQLHLIKNATTDYSGPTLPSTAANDYALTYSKLIYLSQGDYVQVQIFHNKGSNLTIFGSAVRYTSFDAHFVSQ